MKSYLFAGLVLLARVGWADTAFPKPEPEHAFPEIKIFDAAGKPWRTAREDWTGARRRVVEEKPWATWLQSEERDVGDYAHRHQDQVAWICGFFHDFVSPKDGSRLIWTDQIPGRDVPFLRSDSDPRVEITPKLFGGWVYQFRCGHAAMMRRAAQLYRLTNDERHAAWAAGQLDFYADHYLEWGENREGARLYGQTLDVATNLVHYATTVRLLGSHVTPERRARWWRQFFLPQVEVLNRSHQEIHNIATWHRCAVMQVALVFDRPDLWEGALNGEYGLRRQIAQGITSDYLWWEQSFGYNNYVVRAMLTLFTTAGLYGRAGELATEMNVAENMLLSPAYVRFPDGRAPNPADNAAVPLVVPDPAILAAVYRVFPTAIGLREAAKTPNWDTLVDPPSPAPLPAPNPVVQSRNLESSRMGILRAEGWQVFFHYGQLTRSHAQAEALNFAAFYHDDDITHDPGTVGYSSPLHREYYRQGLNHNVPLIDGEGEEPPQRGELILFSASPPKMSARQPHYRPNVATSRTLEILAGTLVDTVTIEAKDAPHRLGLGLHVQGKATLPPTFSQDPAFATSRPPAFRYWRDAQRASFIDRAEILVKFGQRSVRLQFETQGAFTLWHGSTPDFPPARREGFYLELDTSASAATIVTRMLPER